MRVLLGLFWALVGGVIGFTIGALGSSAFASLTNMSTREGGRGYFVIAIGLIGAIVGIIGGFVLYGRSAPTGEAAAYTGSGVLGFVGLVAAITLGMWSFMQLREKPLEYGNSQANLEMEFRIRTVDVPSPFPPHWLNVEVQTSKTRPEGTVNWPDKRVDGEHTIIPVVQGPLYRAGSRFIVVRVGETQIEMFNPPMKRTPNPEADWSEWYSPQSVDPPYGVTPPAPLTAKLAMRYRVRKW